MQPETPCLRRRGPTTSDKKSPTPTHSRQCTGGDRDRTLPPSPLPWPSIIVGLGDTRPLPNGEMHWRRAKQWERTRCLQVARGSLAKASIGGRRQPGRAGQGSPGGKRDPAKQSRSPSEPGEKTPDLSLRGSAVGCLPGASGNREAKKVTAEPRRWLARGGVGTD